MRYDYNAHRWVNPRKGIKFETFQRMIYTFHLYSCDMNKLDKLRGIIFDRL